MEVSSPPYPIRFKHFRAETTTSESEEEETEEGSSDEEY